MRAFPAFLFFASRRRACFETRPRSYSSSSSSYARRRFDESAAFGSSTTRRRLGTAFSFDSRSSSQPPPSPPRVPRPTVFDARADPLSHRLTDFGSDVVSDASRRRSVNVSETVRLFAFAFASFAFTSFAAKTAVFPPSPLLLLGPHSSKRYSHHYGSFCRSRRASSATISRAVVRRASLEPHDCRRYGRCHI